MVCSSCGFENDGTMRFCGMCGTPLPYRPLTTPEAQSTLKYTRLPREDAGETREHMGKPVSSSATMVLPERRAGGNGKTVPTTTIAASPQNDRDVARARATFDPQVRNEVRTVEGPAIAEPEVEPPARGEGAVHVAESDWRSREIETPVEHDHTMAAPPIETPSESHAAPAERHEPPPKDMVPDVPFDEYLRSFHYEPPNEATEVTMRDISVADERVPEHPVQEVVNTAPPEPHAVVSASHAEGEVEAQRVSTVGREDVALAEPASIAVSRDVEDRLGLDAQAAPEVVERPRFLDIHEPVEAEAHAKSGTSTIVGPSFLGLSDAPEVGESAGYEEEEIAHKSHWRGWLAAAVVLVFAGLGYMEWRTQVNQTDNGPVELMKTKIRSWTNGVTAPPSSEAASASAPAASNSKPEMQVQEQPKAQPENHESGGNEPTAANNSNAAAPSSPAKAAAAQATAGTSASKEPGQSLKPAEQSASNTAPASKPSPAADSAQTQTAAEKAKGNRTTASADQQAPSKPAPGGDELKKAANASDSAAAAAWLWKSTAKGNPDAPVQLADMYMKGEGVPRSCEQAVVLLKTAAEKENARARNRLASMYASGNCVQRNRVEAYRWLSSALTANPHSDWAQQNKDLIWQQMTPDERVMAAKYR